MSIENNKLIAEFMGLETPDGCYFEHLTKEGNRELTHHILLEYHTSWDWLMPVVRNVLMTIELDGLYYDTEELRYNTLDCDISGAYKEVVEFIKEYNLRNSMEETEEVSIFDIFININKQNQ